MDTKNIAEHLYQEAVEESIEVLKQAWKTDACVKSPFFNSLNAKQRELIIPLLTNQLIDSVGVVLSILNGSHAPAIPAKTIVSAIQNEELAEEFLMLAEERLGTQRTGPAIF